MTGKRVLSDGRPSDLRNLGQKPRGNASTVTVRTATHQSLRDQVRQKRAVWYTSLFCWMSIKRFGAESGIPAQTTSSVLFGGHRSHTETNEHRNTGGQHAQ